MTSKDGDTTTWAGATGLVSPGRGTDSLRVLGRLLMGIPPGPHVDWKAMADLSRRHGLSPLLFWRLDKGGGEWDGEDRVPADVREGLRDEFYAAAGRALLAEWQLAEMLRAMAVAGVPALVIKGAAMGAFYPDPALRPYGDLDVLVPRAQLDEVEQLLNGLGYRCYRPKAWWSKQRLHLPPMVSGDGRLAVEVHWRLDREEALGRLPAEHLWARAVPWSLGGQAALRLEDVDTVLHLCRHAVVQHRGHLGLRPLCDLAHVTGRWEQAEWDVLSRRVLDYGLERPVYLMLVLAERVLGLAVPPELMASLCPPEDKPIPEDLVQELLWLGESQEPRVPIAVVQAAAKGSRLAQLRHVLWHLLLPRDGMAAAYNVPADSPRIWLTYLWRPVDLLRRYGRTVCGRLRRERRAQAAWEREAWLERWLRAGEQEELETG